MASITLHGGVWQRLQRPRAGRQQYLGSRRGIYLYLQGHQLGGSCLARHLYGARSLERHNAVCPLREVEQVAPRLELHQLGKQRRAACLAYGLRQLGPRRGIRTMSACAPYWQLFHAMLRVCAPLFYACFTSRIPRRAPPNTLRFFRLPEPKLPSAIVTISASSTESAAAAQVSGVSKVRQSVPTSTKSSNDREGGHTSRFGTELNSVRAKL